MLQALLADLHAAQSFGIVFVLVGSLAVASAAGSILLFRSRPVPARRAAVMALSAGASMCMLGIAGFALWRSSATQATASATALPATALERIRRQGDVDAQRLAELGVLGVIPLLVGASIQRSTRRRRLVVTGATLLAGGVLAAWLLPPRGRRLDRRLWTMMDAEAEAEAGRLDVACVELQRLRDIGPAITQAARGPYASEVFDLTPEQIVQLIPAGPVLVDRCVNEEIAAYPDLPSLLSDIDRFGWATPAREALARNAFQKQHPSAPTAPAAASHSPSVEVLSARSKGEASDLRARALFALIKPDVDNCYRTLLQSTSDSALTVNLRISVRGSRATEVAVEGSGPESLRSCIQGHIRATSFYQLHTDAADIQIVLQLAPS
jgi:hypothetical protein